MFMIVLFVIFIFEVICVFWSKFSVMIKLVQMLSREISLLITFLHKKYISKPATDAISSFLHSPNLLMNMPKWMHQSQQSMHTNGTI